MKTNSRVISALLTALFISSALFSGMASAAHCEHESTKSEYEWDYND